MTRHQCSPSDSGNYLHRDVVPRSQQGAGREAVQAQSSTSLLPLEAAQVHRLLRQWLRMLHTWRPRKAAHRHDLQAGARGAGAGREPGRCAQSVGPPAGSLWGPTLQSAGSPPHLGQRLGIP